jgi:hypothetical protein
MAVIAALTGIDAAIDERVQNAVLEQLGSDAFSDEALALMASEYERLWTDPVLPSQSARVQ